MKTIIALIIGALPILAAFGAVKIETKEPEKTDIENIYSDCGLIMTEPDEWVYITMQNGNTFAFANIDNDWLIGDLVAVTMYSYGTDKVVDDEILDYKYAGYISKREITHWIKGGK